MDSSTFIAPSALVCTVNCGISKLMRTWLCAAEIVDLIGLDLVQDAVDRRDVEHVSVLVVQAAGDVLQARLLMLGDRVAPDHPWTS